jgi:hypothetical protein
MHGRALRPRNLLLKLITVISSLIPLLGVKIMHLVDRTDLFKISNLNLGKKGKAVPLQTWSGPEGSRKLRFPDFMTTAQDGGKVVSLTHQPPLLPGNKPGIHFC